MSQGRRLPQSAACAVLMLCLLAIHVTRAQEIRATDKPFLWQIDGAVPSYLYGTVHVPDARVLALPDVVRRALDASDAFYAEIPLDDATAESMTARMRLPQGQNLRMAVGDEAFARLVNLIPGLLPESVPPGNAFRIASQLLPLKPWAALMAVTELLFLEDIVAGREPLDQVLYNIAVKSGKSVGGLETVNEHMSAFDPFTNEELVRMFVGAVDQLEKDGPGGMRESVQGLIELHLAGDIDLLVAEVRKRESVGDAALNERLRIRMEDERNVRMADVIATLCSRTPPRSYFFAIGAAHFGGETSIISLLTKKGFKIRRLAPADAAAIGRRPAA